MKQEKLATRKTYILAKRYVKKKYQQQKQEINKIKEKQAEVEKGNQLYHIKENILLNKVEKEQLQSNISSTIKQKPRQIVKNNVPAVKETTYGNYQSFMKKNVMQKYKRKITNTIQKNKSNTAHNTIQNIIKNIFVSTKKIVGNIRYLIIGFQSLILLVVITLFLGAFAALSSQQNTEVGLLPLSKEVIAYQSVIEKYAKQYDMVEYIPIIQAVMMQESGGKGTDPMQASECKYNKKYPMIPNGITNAEYSIEIGIQYLNSCFKEAKVDNVLDMKNISLGLQGYNYGDGYIVWAIKNFGGYSKANAKVFSDEKKAELKVDVYGDPNYVEHVLRYVGFGFGNFRKEPDFTNDKAWGYNNPYTSANLCGQCTWFVWGRFYEIYGFDPGFRGNGYECVDQLIKAHLDKFELSDKRTAGSLFSSVKKNHVGIIIEVNGDKLTVQEGNLDGITNDCETAKQDWHTKEYTMKSIKDIYGDIEFTDRK